MFDIILIASTAVFLIGVITLMGKGSNGNLYKGRQFKTWLSLPDQCEKRQNRRMGR